MSAGDMNTKITWLLLALPLSISNLYGDDPKGSQVLVAPPPTKKEKEESKTPAPTIKTTNQFVGKPVVYGGYFADFIKAERKRELFDFKTPLDPQKDLENLVFYPGTEHVQAVILFSIKH